MPETPVDVVVKLMNERRVGSVLITDDSRVIGIFTERDLLKKVLAAKLHLDPGWRT